MIKYFDPSLSADLQEYLDLTGYDSVEWSLSSESEAISLGNDAHSGPEATSQVEVHATGNPGSELVFVGEAPISEGAEELLFKMIRAMGYRPEDLFIVNVPKAGADQDRDPTPHEVAASRVALLKVLDGLKPRAVVVLGGFAAQVLLGVSETISKIRGQSWPIEIAQHSVTAFPTFHPAYLLRIAARKKEVWDDLQRVVAFLKV